MKPYFLLIIMFCVSTTVFAQSYEFKVLANRGTNQVNTGESWTGLKTGTTLQTSDVLKLSDGAYIGLVHKTGRTIELKDAGEHKISDLATKVSAGGSTVAAKYADFVLSKMSERDEDGNYRSNVNVTGAVKRAAGGADIVLMMPQDVDVLSNQAILRWNEVENADGYEITLQDMFDEVIKTLSTDDETSLVLDFSEPELKEQNFVKVKIKAQGTDKESTEYGIKRLPEWEADPLKKELYMLEQEISSDNALGKVIFASFYEQNNLLLDALTNYEQAIELSPDIDDFKVAYEDFLLRNGLGQ